MKGLATQWVLQEFKIMALLLKCEEKTWDRNMLGIECISSKSSIFIQGFALIVSVIISPSFVLGSLIISRKDPSNLSKFLIKTT